jgi:hypothetical protein
MADSYLKGPHSYISFNHSFLHLRLSAHRVLNKSTNSRSLKIIHAEDDDCNVCHKKNHHHSAEHILER